MDIDALMKRARMELKRVFGYSDFRPGQEQAICRILSGGDLLAILPTGGGKSICYQIPAIVGEGLTIVISPLISLMKDQVDQLNQLGVEARALNSSVRAEEARAIISGARSGVVRMIYIAPERLDADICRAELHALNVTRIIIDEAHCVSQWGHDFRPSYLGIAQFISEFALRPTVAAFTATATERVRDDIVSQLALHNPEIIKTGYDRQNLEFSVVRIKKALRIAWIRRFIDAHPGQSGIIYCSSRRDAQTLAGELGALCYHAGMEDAERTRAQDDFINDVNPLICATNAFGMGIDKPDVRFVIHYHMPASVEAYWQEAGRAGRDGMAAECVLLGDGTDISFWMQMIARDEGDEEEKRKRRERLLVMADYLRTRKCLRAYLVGYFGEEIADCGACSNCTGGTDAESDTDITRQAQMILSAVKRCGERVGKAMIKRVLNGSRDKRIGELGFDQQSTFGIMKDVDKNLIGDYIDELIAQGYLKLTNDQYPVLKLTSASIPVLRGEQKVYARMDSGSDIADELAQTGSRPAKVGAKSKTNGSQYYGTPLFERLRALRKQIAASKGLPAFMVFGDAALADMARRRPCTREEFLQVSGVGEHKLNLYGDQFLSEIRDFAASESPKAKQLNVLTGEPLTYSANSGNAKRTNPFIAILDAEAEYHPANKSHGSRIPSGRMISDMLLFIRTHQDEFMADFPEYTSSDFDDILNFIRNSGRKPN